MCEIEIGPQKDMIHCMGLILLGTTDMRAYTKIECGGLLVVEQCEEKLERLW